jgi:hypothetical protein
MVDLTGGIGFTFSDITSETSNSDELWNLLQKCFDHDKKQPTEYLMGCSLQSSGKVESEFKNTVI